MCRQQEIPAVKNNIHFFVDASVYFMYTVYIGYTQPEANMKKLLLVVLRVLILLMTLYIEKGV